MITTDYKELLFPIKKVQLIVDKTKLPAGHGILANDRIIHQVLTDYNPTTNESLIKEVEEYLPITWKYAYHDLSKCNFAFVGILKHVTYLIDGKHLVIPGIEILNSYNQRMSPQMYWCFYHSQEKCFIKTNYEANFFADVDKAKEIYLKLDNLFIEDYDNTKPLNLTGCPSKITSIINKNKIELFDKYGKNNFVALLSMAKAITDYWEHTSYELARKNFTKLVDELMLNNKSQFLYSEENNDSV